MSAIVRKQRLRGAIDVLDIVAVELKENIDWWKGLWQQNTSAVSPGIKSSIVSAKMGLSAVRADFQAFRDGLLPSIDLRNHARAMRDSGTEFYLIAREREVKGNSFLVNGANQINGKLDLFAATLKRFHRGQTSVPPQ